MTAIRAKLNSRRGASLLLALLVFLVCAMAGAGALTAASANVGRYQYAEEEEQAYLAVSSAARLVAEALEASKYEAKFTETKIDVDVNPGYSTPGVPTYEIDSKEWTSSLQNLLKSDLDDLFMIEYPGKTATPSPPGEHTVTFRMDGLPDVTATFQLKKISGKAGCLQGNFWVEEDGKHLYETKLKMPSKGWEKTAVKNEGKSSKVETTSTTTDAEGKETTIKTTITTTVTDHTYTLKWEAADKATYERVTQIAAPAGEGGSPP